MLLFMICMGMLTMEIVPPTRWWGYITYVITWPEHLGKWIKDNFEKPVYTVDNTITKEEK